MSKPVFASIAGIMSRSQTGVKRCLETLFRARVSPGADADLGIAIFEQSPTPMVLLDGDTLQGISCNSAFMSLSGYSAEDCKGRPAALLFGHTGSSDALTSRLRNPSSQEPLKVRLHCKDGTSVEMDLQGHSVNLGERTVLSYACQDNRVRARFESRLLEKQQHLDHLAHHDQLTGLPNRLYLAAHLPQALDVAARNKELLAVLFLDLDRFKHINDSCGHETGDELLKAVAQRLRETLRGEDLIIRMGGDEFVVIMKSVRNAEEVNEAARRITEALSSPIIVGGRPLITTASIGVSLYPRDGADMGELLRHSDTAMYQAKERGRNNCQVFSPLMDRRLKQRIAIETHLRLALDSNQLDVHYQPIVEVRSNQVTSLEALLRWNHPSQGAISPARFIGIAEDSGLIVPIGEFVIERVLQDAVRWRKQGCQLVPIAINVSSAQLQRSDLASVIVQLTRKYDLEPTLLHVELTEGTVFDRREGRDGKPNEDGVTRLRDLGIHISIDDFGTGYSSLSYLKRWPVDSIKIDRSFIRELGSDPSDLAIVGAIIAMARHLRVPVIAEGIEGWQQLAKLRELGCARVQGHLIAKPTKAADCRRFLQGVPLELVEHTRANEASDSTGVWIALRG
jgi:diguanylate cyclase (GGDEF)-like protein/PAS domain S-box-containing protein